MIAKKFYLKKRHWVCTFFLLLFSFGLAVSQDIQVKGWVKDNQNEFLPGVTIREEGTTNGAITEDNGTFDITVKKGAILEFSFIGYVTKEVSLKDSKPDKEGVYHVNIILELSTDTKLNEAVVVGFGTQKKASMVSSISTIDPKELKGPTSNLTTMMAGRIPGMISFQRSGEPGRGTDNASFFIRGLSTFGTGKRDPLTPPFPLWIKYILFFILFSLLAIFYNSDVYSIGGISRAPSFIIQTSVNLAGLSIISVTIQYFLIDKAYERKMLESKKKEQDKLKAKND